MNATSISRAANTAPLGAMGSVCGSDASLRFLSGQERTYALNLVRDWQKQLQHLEGLKAKSCTHKLNNLLRLFNHAKVAPWKLNKQHVIQFFDERCDPASDQPLAPATVAGYCSSWRSFQNYMLDQETANEILRTFQVRPQAFITSENSIGVKRHKANWKPKGWALSDDEIDAIDETFRQQIAQAHSLKSKALLPLIRDRVMFHIGIHFALRVSELVTCRLSAFRPSHDPEMARFGNFGTLTVTGKNDVTGTIPMRDPAVYDLLNWYVQEIRPRMLLRRRVRKEDDATCRFDDKTYRVSELLFISERGGIVSPNAVRSRLTQIAMDTGTIANRLTPHTLRHTGCTLMLPVYTPEVAQKYLRHKHLYTTMYYYHPSPLEAGNEVHAALSMFDDDEEDEP